MFVVLSAVLLSFLGLTAAVLDQAFRNSIEAGAEERFQTQVYLLLAALEQEEGEFFVIEAIQEPRYSQLSSGLYGFVHDALGQELWRSDSARTLAVSASLEAPPVPAIGEGVFESIQDRSGQSLFRFSYGILWEGSETPYSVSVLELAAPYYSQIRDFRSSLGRWLGGVAILLLGVLLLLLVWGLRPLGELERQLRRIEEGESERLEGEYPDELRGVTDNLNRLIESERRQRDRYRTTLADLAHSLKTPLSVATGALLQLRDRAGDGARDEAEDGRAQGRAETIGEALQRMNQIVSYQLQRAVASKGQSPLTSRVSVESALGSLLGALRKVYSPREYSVETRLGDALWFRGDEHDLLEVLGNVLDNAFKYGAGRLRITARKDSAGALEIEVEDDGAGIPMEAREAVLQRGVRADTLARGQGIGLAVVTELMTSYGGTVSVSESPLGGALFKLRFPPGISP